MVPIFGIISTAVKFFSTILWCIVLFIISPFYRGKREKLASEITNLTKQALDNMKCGARSRKVYLAARNINLHVVESGNPAGKLVLLVHGFPENWHSWHHLIPHLSKGNEYFVVAMDMRGYNLSDKPQAVSEYGIDMMSDDLHALIKYYKRERAHAVVAHDWGGAIAYHFATHYPRSLDKLVILNAPHTGSLSRELKLNWDQRLKSWYIALFQVPIVPKYLFLHDAQGVLRSMFPRKVTDEEVRYLAVGLMQPGAIDAMLNYYKAAFLALLGMGRRKPRPAGSGPAQVECPTLVLWGEKDMALSRNLANPGRWVPRLTVRYVPNCSHFIQYDAPDDVNKYVAEFLAAK